MFSKARFLALSACGLILVSCGGGGGSAQDPFRRNWYNVFGNQCSSGSHVRPGCNYNETGAKATVSEDPYRDRRDYSWGEYNLGNGLTYVGVAWASPTGVVYVPGGTALNAAPGQVGRDLLADAGDMEEAFLVNAGETFAAKYSLDASAGVRVARLLNDWNTIGRDRARTDADVADFTKRLYGVNVTEVKLAIKDALSGNQDSMKKLVQVAAHSWGTNPETMENILTDWYGAEIEAAR